MEFAIIIFNYLSLLMFFDLFYRLFTPKVKFSIAFISFFLVVVLLVGRMNIFIIPTYASTLRMFFPQLIIFIWIYICFDDPIEFKMFGCLSEILIAYIIEMFFMIVFFLMKRQRTIALFDDSSTLLVLRILSIMTNLCVYEVFLYCVKKYKIVKIPYSSIIIPVLSFFIGNKVMTLGNYKYEITMRLTTVITMTVPIILLFYILETIQVEFEKKSMIVLQNELEKQYQILLEDYLNITDKELLQKYLRHDILNHLLVLNEVKKENDKIDWWE